MMSGAGDHRCKELKRKAGARAQGWPVSSGSHLLLLELLPGARSLLLPSPFPEADGANLPDLLLTQLSSDPCQECKRQAGALGLSANFTTSARLALQVRALGSGETGEGGGGTAPSSSPPAAPLWNSELLQAGQRVH